MSLTDEDLFDFDQDRLAHFDLKSARSQLAEHSDAFRAQLVAAQWIEGWRERAAADELPTQSENWREGFDSALREVAAHLRQGDLIPGGVLHDETDSGRL
jgi:hypothetical protein